MITTRSILQTLGLCALVLGIASCSAPAPMAEAEAGPLPDTPVQEIMVNLMAPAVDAAFILPDILTDPKLAETARPEDIEAAWQRVQRGAITLTEIPNLVVLNGRPITRPGVAVTGEGEGPYLHAAQIAALFRSNRTALLEAARKLQETGLAAQAAAQRRDVKKLSDLGVDIEVVCEGCHTKFWYPPKGATAPASTAK
jgi:hypothetical protein